MPVSITYDVLMPLDGGNTGQIPSGTPSFFANFKRLPYDSGVQSKWSGTELTPVATGDFRVFPALVVGVFLAVEPARTTP